jgi:hypothetical protein
VKALLVTVRSPELEAGQDAATRAAVLSLEPLALGWAVWMARWVATARQALAMTSRLAVLSAIGVSFRFDRLTVRCWWGSC